MDYKTGNKIPEEEVIRRLQDEDGGFYLELRGEKTHLFRVGENNLLFFKLEKTIELTDKLKVIDDYRRTEDYTNRVKQVESAEEDADMDIEPSDEITLKIDLAKIQKKLEEMTFKEGQKIPDGLKNRCKQNTYGGYSFEYNNYFYILDADFRVDIKRAAVQESGDFTLQSEDLVTAPRSENAAGNPGTMRKITLNKGDKLPDHLRDKCEVDLSTGGGFRILIGSSLYILDEDYRVIVKMSQSSQAMEELPVEEVPVVEKENKKQETRHPPEKIVDSVLKKFRIALQVDKINADLFVEKTLRAENKPVLIKVYNGDLSELNEDTEISARRGKIMKLKEGGISLLKAALLHELYLKSTFRGRGERMVEFLTHIISPWKDAVLTITQQDLSFGEQAKLIDFLRKQSDVYADIGDVLHRISLEIKTGSFNEYAELKKEGFTLFKAFLIDKLYQMISRPEKGDGVSLICLSRDIMDFRVSGTENR